MIGEVAFREVGQGEQGGKGKNEALRKAENTVFL